MSWTQTVLDAIETDHGQLFTMDDGGSGKECLISATK
jgi:hypothetical protein